MLPGTVVADRFVIERRAATGGMGSIYYAKDKTTGEPAAVKVVRSHGADAMERLLREGRSLAQLDHPHVVRYLASGSTPEGDPFLAMEWVPGETLTKRLRRSPLAIDEALAIVADVAEALGHAHARGIVHRDVKPSNLILRDDDPKRVVLVDFGVARGRREDRLTKTGMIVGTINYMSPEQARGSPAIEPTADVFAIGCLLYRCITGRGAFEAEEEMAVLAKVLFDDPPPIAALVSGVSPDLDVLVRRLLAKDPADRPANGSAAAEAIRTAMSTVHEGVPSTASLERLTLTERRLVSLVLAPLSIDPDATIVGDEVPDAIAPVRAIATRFGAACEILANGTLAVALVGRGTATDQAAQAAKCALELRTVLAGIPIVLVTGRAVVDAREDSTTGIASSGSADVFEHGAAMIHALARGKRSASIVIDDATSALLDHTFVLGNHEVGAELRGVREGASDMARLLGKVTSCVGRDRELATIEALLAECSSDSVARAALITAPPGMGKSRLLREIVSRVASRAQLLRATCDVLSSGSPHAMITQVLRGASNIDASDSAEARARKLRSRLARHVQRREVDRIAEFLCEAASIPIATPSPKLLAARGDPRIMIEQLRGAWIDWLATECVASPVLLMIDDVQWSDVVSMRLVQDALSSLSESALCVVALGRPEANESVPEGFRERMVPIPLGALSKKACERLVREAIAEAADDVVVSIVARSAGQPLLLEELVRAHAEGRAGDETAIAMVQSRLETIDPHVRRVLRAASVFGEVFWREGVEHLVSSSVSAELDILVAKELVARSPSSRVVGTEELTFRHALMRDAAYVMLTPEDGSLGHRLAAEWLATKPDVDPAILAEHWTRSDRPEAAISYLALSAKQALDAGDFDGVSERARRARDLGVSGETAGTFFRLEAEAHRWDGDVKGAESAAFNALDLVPASTTEWIDSLRIAAFSSGLLGHIDRLVSVSKILLDFRPQGAPAERAWLLAANQATTNLLVVSPGTLSDALLARVETVKPEVLERDPVVGMYHCHTQSTIAFRRGRYEDLLETAQSSVAHAVRAGDVRFAALHTTNVGFAFGQLGELELALATLRAGREDGLRFKLQQAVRTLDQNIGHVLMCLGRLDEARDVELSVLPGTKEQAPRLHAIAHACLARIEVRRGDFDEARRCGNVAVDGSPTSVPLVYSLSALAEAELAGGQTEAALAHATRAVDLSRELQSTVVGDMIAGRVVVEALLALGRRDEAKAALEMPLSLLRSRIDCLKNAIWRKTTVSRVEDHRRVLELEKDLAS